MSNAAVIMRLHLVSLPAMDIIGDRGQKAVARKRHFALQQENWEGTISELPEMRLGVIEDQTRSER